MKSRLSHLVPWIQGNFLALVVAWIALSIVAIIFADLKVATIIFTLALLGEVGLRLLFTLVYGRHYAKSLWLYLLADHPVYGYGLRPSVKLRELDFPILDNFAFPWGMDRKADLAANHKERVDFNIDEFGFRGKGFDPKRKSARLRIFCSGGSTTACDSVDDNQTWPAVLERELKARGLDVEIINAGVQGWFSYQEYLRYEREIRHYQPDVVLLHQGWNEEFNYSSLNLGRFWRPKLVRNVLETNYLYSPPNRILSSRFSLVWLFAVHALLWRFVFLRTMRFTNPARWRCLFAHSYMEEWFDSMLGILRLAATDNVLAYTIDYPSLVDIADKPTERQHIIRNTIVRGRLTPHFADFQAIAKKGTSYFLREMSQIVPCLDANSAFAGLSVNERLSMFGDELHYTAAGCERLGRALAEKLASDPAFQARYAMGKASSSNIHCDKIDISGIRARAVAGRPYLHRLIAAKITALLDERIDPKLSEIPVDRYTTL